MSFDIGAIKGKIALNANDWQRAIEGVKRDQAEVTKRSSETALGIGRIETALKAVAGVAAARWALRVSDDYLALQQRIRTATKETGDYVAVSQELYDLSQRNRVPLESTVSLFQGISRMGPALKATNEEALKVVSAVGQLGVIGGSTQYGMTAAMLQFQQAMASGVVRAEEINSLFENMPELARRIEQGLGMAPGHLRKAVIEGKVLSRDVFHAILKQTEEINREFAGIDRTLPQAMTQLRNAAAKAFGEFNQGVGVTRNLSAGLEFASRNMDDLVVAAEALVAIQLARYMGMATAATVAYTAALRAQVAASGYEAVVAGRLKAMYAGLGGPVGVVTLAALAIVEYSRRVNDASRAEAALQGELDKSHAKWMRAMGIGFGQDKPTMLKGEVEAEIARLERQIPQLEKALENARRNNPRINRDGKDVVLTGYDSKQAQEIDRQLHDARNQLKIAQAALAAADETAAERSIRLWTEQDDLMARYKAGVLEAAQKLGVLKTQLDDARTAFEGAKAGTDQEKMKAAGEAYWKAFGEYQKVQEEMTEKAAEEAKKRAEMEMEVAGASARLQGDLALARASGEYERQRIQARTEHEARLAEISDRERAISEIKDASARSSMEARLVEERALSEELLKIAEERIDRAEQLEKNRASGEGARFVARETPDMWQERLRFSAKEIEEKAASLRALDVAPSEESISQWREQAMALERVTILSEQFRDKSVGEINAAIGGLQNNLDAGGLPAGGAAEIEAQIKTLKDIRSAQTEATLHMAGGMSDAALERQIEYLRQFQEQAQLTAAETRDLNAEIGYLSMKLEDRRGGPSAFFAGARQAANDWIRRMSSMATAGQAAFNRISGVISNRLDAAIDGVIDGTMSIKEAFAQMAKAVLADIAKLIAKMIILAALGAAIGGMFGAPAAGAAVGMNLATGGGFASGTAFVPDTGPYILHEGESVLTPSETQRRASGVDAGAGQGEGVTVAVVLTPEALATAMASSAGRNVILHTVTQDAMLRGQSRRVTGFGAV